MLKELSPWMVFSVCGLFLFTFLVCGLHKVSSFALPHLSTMNFCFFKAQKQELTARSLKSLKLAARINPFSF